MAWGVLEGDDMCCGRVLRAEARAKYGVLRGPKYHFPPVHPRSCLVAQRELALASDGTGKKASDPDPCRNPPSRLPGSKEPLLLTRSGSPVVTNAPLAVFSHSAQPQPTP